MSLYDVLRPYALPDRPLDPPEPKEPVCPVCGSECSTVYRDAHGDICGCDNCMAAEDAWEAPECSPEGE